MAASGIRIARLMRVAAWRALAGAEVVGEANAMLRPDRRWFISVDTWIADSFLPLVSAVADDLRQDLYTTVDEGDQAELPAGTGDDAARGRVRPAPRPRHQRSRS
jgi:hypothetical protein